MTLPPRSIVKLGEYYLTPTDITIEKTEAPCLTTTTARAWAMEIEEARAVARLFGGTIVQIG